MSNISNITDITIVVSNSRPGLLLKYTLPVYKLKQLRAYKNQEWLGSFIGLLSRNMSENSFTSVDLFFLQKIKPDF